MTADGSLIDISKIGCRFSLRDFDVDTEGNLYCQEQVLIGRNFEYEPMGAMLSKWSCDGEKVYQKYYPDMSGFALCGNGEACVLGEGRIILVNEDGVQADEISTEQYWGNGEPLSQNLLRDAEWHTYYTLNNSRGIGRSFEVLTDESLQLLEMGESFYSTLGGNSGYVCVSSARKLFSGGAYTDILYEHDVENGSVKEVLNWIDSGFLCTQVRSVARISSEELLVNYESDIYLLTRTSVEELPERETVVIFSYEPTNALKETVLQFNKESDKYRIVIDDYGMEFSWVTRQGDSTRVDLAVVSQTPPDILDMTFLDVHKYAQKGVLEDLLPYLEESSILNREDFLENALEGMTINGCLTCIPNEFSSEEWLMGRKRQLGTLERWGMEDVYELSERYPESAHRLIGDILGDIEKRDYLLNTFCAYYCLEEFIDWTKKECRFDSEEFVRLLKWVQEYAEGNPNMAKDQSAIFPYIAEEVLLFHNLSGHYDSMSGMGVRCGDETVLMGFPSADGEGVYPVYVRDALSITANSANKEGAWAFLEYFLSTSKTPSFGLSTKKDCIYEGVKDAALQKFIPDDVLRDETERRIAKGWVNVEEEMVPYYAISQEQADALMKAIESADFTPRSEKEKMILRIISEEAESYYNGDKSIEEVIQIIQNRAGLILQE